MNKITKVHSRQVFDSRGNPTIEAEVFSKNISATAICPSGASTGTYEAYEKRDTNNKKYLGKSVFSAIKLVNSKISKKLKNKNLHDQELIDSLLINLDGTKQKSNLGANSILAVSMASMNAYSNATKKHMYELVPNIYGAPSLPVPFMNILNGGAHADNKVDIQEFMIVPHGFTQFDSALRAGVEIYHTLKQLLKDRGLATNVGDEGGFAPNLNSSEEVLKIIIEAVEKADYKMEEQVSIALDAASSEFYNEGEYQIENQNLSSSEMVDYLVDLTKKFPIISIEDGLAEDDWNGWNELTEKIGDTTQLVGDDLFVTQSQMLEKGIEQKSANSILIKVNQVGSLSETYETMELANTNDFTSMVSHRSGETENIFISHLVTGTSSGQIKTGAPARSERTAKYNELLRIGEVIGLDNFNNKKWIK